jgi:hypothetical protein
VKLLGPALLPPALAVALAVALASAACSSSVGTSAPAPTAPAHAAPAGTAPAGTPAAPTDGCCGPDVLQRALETASRHRVEAISARRFTHAEFWAAVTPSTASPALRTTAIGRSLLGREIRAVTFGRGPTRVLLWSQMHGDESTATMALADIFRFLADGVDDPLRERLARELTVVFVPMLNPDGAELFQRENAAGIDVNRDGRRLVTPEARALKTLHDSLRPAFGFNLHDQNARTRVGATGAQAAIALLAPAYDSTRGYNAVRSRARLLAASIATTLAHDIPGRIAKYDDSFNPRAFGDLIQQWGTSTVLIESGALPGDPQKQRLRSLNAAGILSALDAIATRSYERGGAAAYDALPYNTGGANDLLVLGGRLVLPGQPPLLADLAINYDDPVARSRGLLREVGDLREVVALDTLDATGLFLHPRPVALRSGPGGSWLRIGAAAELDVRRGADAGSELVRQLGVAAGQ